MHAPAAAPLPCYAMFGCSSRTFQFAARPQNRMLCPRRGSHSQRRPALLHRAAVLSDGMPTSCGVMRHQPHCSPEPQNVTSHFLNPARVFAHPPFRQSAALKSTSMGRSARWTASNIPSRFSSRPSHQVKGGNCRATFGTRSCLQSAPPPFPDSVAHAFALFPLALLSTFCPLRALPDGLEPLAGVRQHADREPRVFAAPWHP